MDVYEWLAHWQSDYCAGSPMPNNVRQAYSNCFKSIFSDENKDNTAKDHNYIVNDGTILYRIIDLEPISKKQLILDNLYYSCTKTLAGLSQVIKHDRYLKFSHNLAIFEIYAHNALDYNALMGFDIDSNIYTPEQEVVSQISVDNIKSIYYITNIDDISKYSVKGEIINLRQVGSSNKYKIRPGIFGA